LYIFSEVGDEEWKDDIVYIQNVVVGRKPLSKAQYQELDQQVESSVYDTEF